MNCDRCHHTDEAHAKSPHGDPMTGLEGCMIPGCTCRRYRDGIREIDDYLL